MEYQQDNSKVIICLIFLILSVFILSLSFDSPGEVIVGAIVTLISFLIVFKIFLPGLEEKFIKSIILTIITIFTNVLFRFIGFSGALFAIVIQFMSLRYITKMDFFSTIILVTIITIINFLIVFGIVFLKTQIL